MAQPGQPVGGDSPKKFNWAKLLITLVLIAGLVCLILYALGVFNSDDSVEHRSWKYALDHKADIKSIVIDGQYHEMKVESRTEDVYKVALSDDLLEHWMKAAESGSTESNTMYTVLREIQKTGADVNYEQVHLAKSSSSGWIVSLLISLLPMAIFIGFMFYMYKRSGQMGDGGIMSTGKSPAKKIISKKRFSDVAGQEEVKEEVSEVVDFLKRPAKYKAAGARIPKGILLGGPPGTGKTLLAKAVAGESGVPFFFISASNFVEMFAGMGAKRVREMFKEARKNAPSILFIDELDAVGRKRGSSLSGNDEREQTLNQILVEMDGMDETNGLLIIAATNRPDVLDPALKRPGRFDRTITVSLPDIKEREAILRLHAKGKRISDEVDFKNIAKRTPRYSGAELESVINESALLSVREDSDLITLSHIDEAIDRVAAGPAKKHRVITPEENKMVARHEAGHAVVGLINMHADIIQKITIIPRGDAGGYTLTTPRKELYNYSKSQLEAKIIGYLGGRAAEQVYYGEGEVSTGASNDIQMATNIARVMVTQYGMSHLGPIAYEKAVGSEYLGRETQKEYSDALAERIDEAIRKIILEAERKSIEIIKANTELVDLIVEELLDKETIVLEEIEYIFKHRKRPAKKDRVVKLPKKKSVDEMISEIKAKKEAKEAEPKAKKPRAKKTTTTKTAKPKSTKTKKEDDKK